ncbi:hypothetical protein CD30_06765 [Ureibacillus massiliensis 4400831 = CIP 108448 = CCUG 49529]|uniref:Uncharacterized protein n=1 Tax=Ureibacillus massiliensis 4400831 = CIP 108448 = CCUG 49529 TaxID=1211035 RepID=A0A0A3J345_9BACL|nr:hypothetical protein [Ureibacillus massiliensis]KGR91321.1 hypothetical protein CD30_06765 [Ureibacillus massiliensis 4400831 = CIP 108448 = CCUG 49529]
MRIPKARYITEDDIKMVTLNEITKKKYDAIYKGKLFCPTDNCPAKVSFCSGQKAHYKTWRFSNHSPDCIYHLNRNGRRTVVGSTPANTMNISKTRIQDALSRAYKSMVEVDGSELIQPSNNKPKKNDSPKTNGAVKEQSFQLKLFGGDLDEESSNYKGKKLLSRWVHLIAPNDVGQVRLIKGYVKDVELLDSAAEIIIGFNNEEMKVVFEERFRKEPLNKSYLNKFWAIKEMLSHYKEIYFTGVGEVREDRNGKYELSIFMGASFKLNNEDLYNIARVMSLQQL